MFMLLVLYAHISQAFITPPFQKYGFDTWTEGWAAGTNASMQAVTAVAYVSKTNMGVQAGGTGVLRIDLDLRPSPASNAQGRVWVNMQQDRVLAYDVPVNLSNRTMRYLLYWPSGGDAARGTNSYRMFVADADRRCQCFPWVNVSTGGILIDASLTVNSTNGTVDPGYDPTAVRYIGMDVRTAPGSTGIYSGPVFVDGIRFTAPPGYFTAPTNQKFSFDTDNEGFQLQTYQDSQALTNRAWVTNAPLDHSGGLALHVHLDEDTTNFAKGEVFVDLEWNTPTNLPDMDYPLNLNGKRTAAWVYCPPGLAGPATNPNSIQVFFTDTNWHSFYGSPQHVTTGYWMQVSATPSTNQALQGWKHPDFDPAAIKLMGIKLGAGTDSATTYDGLMYLDGFSFTTTNDPIIAETNDLRYGFEPNREGWRKVVYEDTNDYHGSLTGVVQTALSTNYAIQGTRSLRMAMGIINETTNRQKGAVAVDLTWYPPPSLRAPFNLDGRRIHAYIYCPDGSASTNPAKPNTAQIYVKSKLSESDWPSQYGTPVSLRNAHWIELLLTPSTNTPPSGYTQAGFDPTNIYELGINIEMGGVYTGAMYLDNIGFEYDPVPAITHSQHIYDFGYRDQQEWWQWGTSPDAHNAKAWTNTYYITNAITDCRPALAAAAAFRTNNSSEVVTNQHGQVITNQYVFQKGIYEIAYQPAMNLSTKDNRRCQARLRFDPPVEGLLSFEASFKMFDKITDQWYFKNFNVGGSGWNILDWDLDNPADYATNLVEDPSPPGPMDASAIGFCALQLFANVSWTGTVYLGEVVLGGVESGTNFQRITSAFVQPARHKYVIDGTNFYHCGANIEYLQTVPDAVVEECLDWCTNMGIKAVRTWAMQEGQPYSFQPERGVWNELMFEHLDRIVAMAGDRDIRLMLAVLDNWAHNGGVFQYVHWVTREHPETVNTNLNPEGVRYHDQFWTNTYCRQWYRDYVSRLLNRTNTITGVQYKDDPTIFAWEIVNEPRCESDFNGRTIHNWLHTMSDWIRTIDTNHMLGPGEEGGYVRTYADADEVGWEVYPDNYYHYGVYATGSSTCDLYGCGRGHGVDFISDMSSTSNYVTWQAGGWSNADYSPPQGEWRSGNSNIHFCTCRLYIDQKEYNVWRTNFNSADQRLEWINDHWYEAHRIIGKPMLLEEFGIHAIGWVFNGSYGQVQLVPDPKFDFEDRARIYQTYYRHVENCGIPGSYFWNFGYDGMWNDPFHTCDAVSPWYAYTDQWSAVDIEVSTNYVQQGTNSLRLVYDVADIAGNRAVYICPTNAMWVLRVDRTSTNDPPTRGINRVKFFWQVYSPTNAVNVALNLRGTAGNILVESLSQTVPAGSWTNLMFDLSAGTWAWAGNAWTHSDYLIHITNSATGTNILEDVNEVSLVIYDLPVGGGDCYIDDIQIKRDDGFVVYANDPVCSNIQAHAIRMNARNVSTNRANTPPTAGNIMIDATAFLATNFQFAATDTDGDPLTYRLLSQPTNGWVFGSPPSNMLYKTRPGVGLCGDSFTYVAHDGIADSSVATVQVAVVDDDRDGDSLADEWEYTYFPKRVQWWPDSEEDMLTNMWPAGDWDGDGFDNRGEYYAGTDPTNISSFLGITNAAHTGSIFRITWPSVTGITYRVERSTNLTSGFSIQTTNAATPPSNVYTDQVAPSASGSFMYRIGVE
jgi:mannan endo-1,4-beta-mannosidase